MCAQKRAAYMQGWFGTNLTYVKTCSTIWGACSLSELGLIADCAELSILCEEQATQLVKRISAHVSIERSQFYMYATPAP